MVRAAPDLFERNRAVVPTEVVVLRSSVLVGRERATICRLDECPVRTIFGEAVWRAWCREPQHTPPPVMTPGQSPTTMSMADSEALARVGDLPSVTGRQLPVVGVWLGDAKGSDAECLRALVNAGITMIPTKSVWQGLALLHGVHPTLAVIGAGLPSAFGGDLVKWCRSVGIKVTILDPSAESELSTERGTIRRVNVEAGDASATRSNLVAAWSCFSPGFEELARRSLRSLGNVMRAATASVLLYPNVAVDRHADALAVTRRALKSSIQAHAGVTFRTWRVRTTMSAAAAVLQWPDCSIKAVAYEFGYKAPSAFTRVYRSASSRSPRALLESWRPRLLRTLAP